MGVTVLLNQRVHDVGPKGVSLDGQFIETGHFIWAAGTAPLRFCPRSTFPWIQPAGFCAAGSDGSG